MGKIILKQIAINIVILFFIELVYFGLFGQRMDCSQPMVPWSMLCMEHWNIFVIVLAKYLAPIAIAVVMLSYLYNSIKDTMRKFKRGNS